MSWKNKLSLSVLFFLPYLMEAQCAMCRAVLQSSGNKGQAEAINDGIMYLMVFPYILVAGLGFFVWWKFARQGKKDANKLQE